MVEKISQCFLLWVCFYSVRYRNCLCSLSTFWDFRSAMSCHATNMYLKESINFHFKRFPWRNLWMSFTWLLCSSRAHSTVLFSDWVAWIFSKISTKLSPNECESYLSDDSQLKELWGVVDNCKSANGQNVHPCCPQMRNLKMMLVL